MSNVTKSPPMPPPLCSPCKIIASTLGKTPRRGGFGAVYKGALRDGQVVAVKHHKVMSACAQAAFQFISEDEILSCAQHRSLVVLVGYCIEIVWLLVYGYPCNGSLDHNLCGPN
ncbi:hypothetical protein WN943_003434 [Citrus x changshan-huyou]|uniref:Serine-threonine/tyrosine-protein kinase catalytic domain-containing protein n=1 Tax=Citrus sinensis TaxID=2711 RepID=A0A067ESZ6_CITSI|nr:hypothetical protein CISIN_1g044522mg [Citrus sinensis]